MMGDGTFGELRAEELPGLSTLWVRAPKAWILVYKEGLGSVASMVSPAALPCGDRIVPAGNCVVFHDVSETVPDFLRTQVVFDSGMDRWDRSESGWHLEEKSHDPAPWSHVLRFAPLLVPALDRMDLDLFTYNAAIYRSWMFSTGWKVNA